MIYKDQLLDPRWQKKRLSILERDNWKCTYCDNDKSTLMVHHLIYEHKFAWEADDENLITLCQKCHEVYHNTFAACEKIILTNLRKKLKDPFIITCAAELFNDVNNLNDFIYSLWESRFEENNVLDAIRHLPSSGMKRIK